jgi:predicted PurR-regulated permease PerM
VFVAFLVLLSGFVAIAVPPLAQQVDELIKQAPQYLQQVMSGRNGNERNLLAPGLVDG